MAIRLEQRPAISEGDVEMVAIDFTPWLDDGELLATVGEPTEIGTITVIDGVETITSSEDLTLSNESVSEATLSILRKTVAIGKAAQFSVAGQQSGNMYLVRLPVTTDATPAREKVIDVVLVCV